MMQTHSIARSSYAFYRNLLSGLVIALPLPGKRPAFTATVGQLLALIVLTWLLGALDDWIEIGPRAIVSVWGIQSQAAYSYFSLAALAILVIINRRPADFLILAVAFGSAAIALHLAWMLVTHGWSRLHPESMITAYRYVWAVFLAWEMWIFFRVVYTVLGWRIPRAILSAAFYTTVVFTIVTYLPHRALFNTPWIPPDDERVDVEATYYAQGNLLKQALFDLSPQRADVADFYFVGFGSYAAQDVFKREVEQATVIFERQFDAIGRTLMLINNSQTARVVPLANRHNLDTAINGIAQVIDREEDVVVLFMSSHGGEDATISVDFDGFSMNDLDAGAVRAILDKHEIKWRVVIVSACYSGSFIEDLTSPTTLIITAASADRASFGCAHENDWTYFGEAFFEGAMQTNRSFEAAFETARQRIAEREETEGKIPSTPRIVTGDEIRAYLQRIDR